MRTLREIIAEHEAELARPGPENPERLLSLANLYNEAGRDHRARAARMRAAEVLCTRLEFDLAVAILERMSALHPDDAEIRERLAGAILMREKWKRGGGAESK